MCKIFFLKKKEKQYKEALRNNENYSDEEVIKEYKDFLKNGIVFEDLFKNDRFFVDQPCQIISFSTNIEKLYCYTINSKEKIIDNFKVFFVSIIASLCAVASTLIALFK